MDAFGTAISLSLQYGVPLEVLVNKFSHTRFEPMGYTTNPDIRIAKSIVDYIFRWLGQQFLPQQPTDGQTVTDTSPEPSPLTALAKSSENSPTRVLGYSPPTFGAGQGGSTPSQTKALPLEFSNLRDRQFASFQADAPVCDNCGSITVRNGNCYLCHQCGNSMGCS